MYNDIAKGVETRFDTSNHELERPLLKGKMKKELNKWKMNNEQKS